MMFSLMLELAALKFSLLVC